jgi:hypothetical protein
MTYFPEQLPAAGTRQFDAQLDFMRAMTAQAVATAEQVLALNISTSRASAERAAHTIQQLFSVTDPRDLLTIGSQTQEQLSAMYAYGRELLNIATDARLQLVRHSAGIPTPAPEQPVPQQSAPAAPAPEQPVTQQAAPAAPAHQPEEAAPAANEADKLLAGTDAPGQAGPRAKAKPIAKAVDKATGKRSGAPHPSAAPLVPGKAGDVALPRLDPAEVAPVLELKPRKSQRKK